MSVLVQCALDILWYCTIVCVSVRCLCMVTLPLSVLQSSQTMWLCPWDLAIDSGVWPACVWREASTIATSLFFYTSKSVSRITSLEPWLSVTIFLQSWDKIQDRKPGFEAIMTLHKYHINSSRTRDIKAKGIGHYGSLHHCSLLKDHPS